MQEVEYVHENEQKVARWSDIRKLFESKLDEISVNPKPIERQRASTCLKIFCDETIAVMKVHTKIDNAEGTIILEDPQPVDKKFRHEMLINQQISKDEDESLKFLESFADMAEQMTPVTKRCKQLTKDTARAISHTCKGLIELSHNLLSKTHEYVLFC